METTKELKWVLTEYGKRRITELLSNPEERVRISVMQIGDNGTGEPGEREYQDRLGSGDGKLFHQVGADLPVFEKGIAEDRENTVYFKVIIDENLCGFNICELALYENRSGALKMFAVGTGEPIVKPSMDLGYLISVEYTLYIESANLLDVYDRIELEPANEFLKAVDIEGIYKTVLYVEGNLAEQISHNTHLLGLGRAQQLNDLISNTQLRYNSASIANYYANMSNTIKDLNNLLGFWSFGYTDVYGVKSNIKDFSGHATNLSTNAVLSSYEQDYLGVLSSLKFTDKDYFYIDKISPVTCATPTIEVGSVIEHNESGNLIWSTTYGKWGFNGYLFTEDEVRERYVQYYLYATGASTTSESITLGNIQDGRKAFAPHTFTYNGSSLKWVNECDTAYDTEYFKNNVVEYTGTPKAGDTITLTTSLTPSDGDTIILTGEQFDLIEYKWEDMQDGTGREHVVHYDVPFTFIASLKHNTNGKRCTLLAQSNYFNGIHNFEIVKTERNAIEVTLFTDRNRYYKCWTSDWSVPNALYNVIITYDGNKLRPEMNIYINGSRPTTYDNRDNDDFAYIGMQPNIIETTSYVREVGTDNKKDPIDAQLCFMSLIREELSPEYARCNALILNSLCGKNVYYKV